MKQNFKQCLEKVLKHEGGFSNHPNDPGRETNYGVTQATYDAWRRSQGMPPSDVRFISRGEVEKIYKENYWDAIRGDELPSGVDYAVFDYAVNSGVSRAAKTLQRLVGVKEDGVIGPKTLAAVNKKLASLSADICDERLAFLKNLPTWSDFGRTWSRRVADVRNASGRMII